MENSLLCKWRKNAHVISLYSLLLLAVITLYAVHYNIKIGEPSGKISLVLFIIFLVIFIFSDILHWKNNIKEYKETKFNSIWGKVWFWIKH